MSRFVEALNEQIASEFAASQQYVAMAVHYDIRRSASSRGASTGRRSRSAITR